MKEVVYDSTESIYLTQDRTQSSEYDNEPPASIRDQLRQSHFLKVIIFIY
jgi:hypothetical protein